MYELRNRKHTTNANERMFRYVWSRDGKIFVRTKEELAMDTVPRPRALQRPEDLDKLGWTAKKSRTLLKTSVLCDIQIPTKRPYAQHSN